jgi:hypothetical protein
MIGAHRLKKRARLARARGNFSEHLSTVMAMATPNNNQPNARAADGDAPSAGCKKQQSP